MGIDQQHWLQRARRVESPNWDERKDPQDISLVVVHCISLPEGKFGGSEVESLFCNTLDCSAHASFADLAGMQVSAHVFIDRRGKLTQFVAFDKRAWHAGISTWRGRSGCNDFAIGIELEGVAGGAYTQRQYRRLDSLLRQLFAHYPALSTEAVVGHQQIAPQRKQDPGPGFTWGAVLSRIERG